MKKFVVVLLALAMLLTLCACGKKQEEAPVIKVGMMNTTMENDGIQKHLNEHHSADLATMQDDPTVQTYDNLSSTLLALGAGEINVALLNKTTVDYVIAHNDKYIIDPNAPVYDKEAYRFSMLTADTNAELHAILDGAIKELKANGKLEQLIANDLRAFINGDPTPAALPTFEGAKTYKVGVTGDVPPMDFVTADGKAAGFNVALLTEIANIAQVNFELVQIEVGARTTALTTGKVDAVFWTLSIGCLICGEWIDAAPAGTLITDSYFSDAQDYIMLKPAA